MAKDMESTKMDKSQDKAMIIKAFKQHDAQEHKGGKGTSLKLAKAALPVLTAAFPKATQKVGWYDGKPRHGGNLLQ